MTTFHEESLKGIENLIKTELVTDEDFLANLTIDGTAYAGRLRYNFIDVDGTVYEDVNFGAIAYTGDNGVVILQVSLLCNCDDELIVLANIHVRVPANMMCAASAILH